MITKKDIPFKMLLAIEPIAQENLDLIQLKREENTYYCFIENDSQSSNFFKILIQGEKRIGDYDRSGYVVELKPIDESGTRNHIFQGNLESVVAHFQKWLKLIRSIHDTPSVHDDNFIRHYSEYYFNEFRILDPDAEVAPFNPQQQHFIDIYIDSLSEVINTSQESINQTAKEEILLAIAQLKTSLAISTKNKVMRGFSNIFAKLFKESKPFGIEVVKEARKQLISKLFDLGIKYGPDLIKYISKHFSHPHL